MSGPDVALGRDDEIVRRLAALITLRIEKFAAESRALAALASLPSSDGSDLLVDLAAIQSWSELYRLDEALWIAGVSTSGISPEQKIPLAMATVNKLRALSQKLYTDGWGPK